MRIFLDHLRRVAVATAGFRTHGANWLRPWCLYLLSPLLKRCAPKRVVHFAGFNARLGEGDLYTFANTFEDYPVDLVRRALHEVEQVVDLGANVGAFSHLVRALCAAEHLDCAIKAVEPNARNVEFLRAQPFGDKLEIHAAAVGPTEGVARLIPGENSVTDHIDFSEKSAGTSVRVIALEGLCDCPTLVKMDIEGGEWALLRHGLPDLVRHLFLEWHPDAAAPHVLKPGDLVAGDWREVSRDPYGSTMWYLRR